MDQIPTARFLPVKASGPLSAKHWIQASPASSSPLSLLLPFPRHSSDAAGPTFNRALPSGRPFCSPGWMGRPIWGGLRLKGPYCPSPRGPRAQARKMISSLNTLPPHPKGYRGNVCRLVKQIIVSQLAQTLNTETNPFSVQTWKCALKWGIGGSNLRKARHSLAWTSLQMTMNMTMKK